MFQESKVAVIPAGTWGSVWGKVAAEQNHPVMLYIRNTEDCEVFNETHTYPRRVPGVVFPELITATPNPKKAVDWADVVVIAPRVQDFRTLIRDINIRPNQIVLNLSKGIETDTNFRMSEIFEQEYPGTSYRYSVWSGFNLAPMIAKSKPEDGVVAEADIASTNPAVNLYIQELFGRGSIKLSPTNDVIGVELGGALKNIMAMAAGLSDGFRLDDEIREYIIYQGIKEMANLGAYFGACRETFLGHSGQGDLIGSVEFQSRNYRAGVLLAEDAKPSDLITSGQTYEGLSTIKPAFALAKQARIKVPIIRMMNKIVYGNIKPLDAFHRFLENV